MSELEHRLIQCFAAVFPNLPQEALPRSTVENVPEWDSLATVTLAAVLEQEFGEGTEGASFHGITSFIDARDYLQKRKLPDRPTPDRLPECHPHRAR